MKMEYQNWMDYTWSNDNQTHQMDPLSIVKSPDSEDQVPLYTIFNMSKTKALDISTPWRLLQLRKTRDVMIAETDWWVLPDRTPTPAQLAYRQALRDITENFDPEKEIIFPEKP